jgi:dTDP-3,4-didehydro-2,6-dideoxy-alpha-D-glucose 3-reductase
MSIVNDIPHVLPLRVGILGCSDIARRKFIPALLQSRMAALAAIASRDRSKSASISGVSGSIMDYGELIASPDVDLVYISLPNDLHEEWSIRALKAGKHVLCEKPLGLALQSVNRMADCAEESGLLLFENLMYQQHPQHSAVKRLIIEGRIGRVTGMTSVFRFPGPQKGDFRLNPLRGGGAFHDINRYPLSAALYFLNGESYRLLDSSAVTDNGLNLSAQASYVTSAGELFSLSIGFGFQYESFYEIEGDRGTIRVDRAYTTPPDMVSRVRVTCDGSDASFDVAPCDHFLATIDHVCSLIATGGGFMEEYTRSRRVAQLAETMITGSSGSVI